MAELSQTELLMAEQARRIEEELQLLQQQYEQIQSTLAQYTAKRQQINSSLLLSEQNFQSIDRQVKHSNTVLQQLQQQRKQFTSQIENAQNVIVGAEARIVSATLILDELNTELSRVGDSIKYQKALLGTHDNQRELWDYDQFVLATL